MKTLLAIATAVISASASSALAITRGEVMDMTAADDTIACFRQYETRAAKSEHPAIWLMCAEVVAEMTGRDIGAIKERVVEYQRRDVFAPD